MVFHEAQPQVAGIAGEEIAFLELKHIDVDPPGVGAHGRLALTGKCGGHPAAFQTGGETPLFAPSALGTVIHKAALEGPAVFAAPGISFPHGG